MDTFFSSIVKAKFNSRESCIKQTLIETLSDNAKEIQYELKDGMGANAIGGEFEFFATFCAHFQITIHHFLIFCFLQSRTIGSVRSYAVIVRDN